MIKYSFRWLCTFTLMVSSQGVADISSTYGLGSNASALVNSNRAFSSDAFSMSLNPALLAYQEEMLSLGFQGAVDQFKDLNDVVIENEFTGSTAQRTGAVDTDVPDVFIATLGNVWKFGESPNALRAGINLALPADKVAEPNMGDGYLPQYALYQSDAQRFNLSFAAGKKIGRGFSLGVGAYYYFVTGATYRARMPTDSSSDPKTTTAKLRAAVRPALAPFLGIHWSDDRTYLGLSYVSARDYKFEAKVENIIDLLGGGSLLAFNATGSLFYDPEVWSAHWALNQDHYKLFLSLDYERWSPYSGPYLDLNFETFVGTFRSYDRGNAYKDIWVPRVGSEVQITEKTELLFGYSFRPTPIPEQKGATNLLDSDRHIVGLGSRFSFDQIFIFEVPGEIVIHSQYQHLVSKKVDKNLTTDIGSPGYEVGGQIWAYGVQLNLKL